MSLIRRILPSLRFALAIVTAASIFSPSVAPAQSFTTRTENEIMLAIPDGKHEEVWEFLTKRFNRSFEVNGERFNVIRSVETFSDVYFDTPDRKLLNQWAGLRHRMRVGEGGHEKQLVQLKITPRVNEDRADQNRQEVKFNVVMPVTSQRDLRSFSDLLSIIEKGKREQLLAKLDTLGVEPSKINRLLTVTQERRRLYFRRDGKQYLTLTVDTATGHAWFLKTTFSQLESEIGENMFTGATDEERQRLLSLQKALAEIATTKFPDLVQNQSPKVVTVVAKMVAKPFGPLLLATSIDNFIIATCFVLAFIALYPWRRKSRVRKAVANSPRMERRVEAISNQPQL